MFARALARAMELSGFRIDAEFLTDDGHLQIVDDQTGFDPPTDAQAFVRDLDAYFREALAGATLPEPLVAPLKDD